MLAQKQILYHRIGLAILLVISMFAFGGGTVNSLTGNASGFTPLFWILGMFTWNDAFVIGIFFFIGAIFLLTKDNPTWTGMFFSLYVAIRAFFETKYNMDAQFSPITRPWEAALPGIAEKFNLKLVELFVIAQVFYMCICIAALMVFLYYFKRYLQEK
jgi:uncharacterized membrane protein YuzA (DUF378 family)